MLHEVTAPEVLTTLKRALKARRITYGQIAEHLQLSEQSIKRLFREGDCSLGRLVEICVYANIGFTDLLAFAESRLEPLAELSSAQCQYLAERPGHFTILFLLSIGEQADAIQSTYNLPDTMWFNYLRDLSQQGFIDLGANNHITLRFKGQPMMRLHGPLHEQVRRVNTLFLNHAIDQDGDGGALFTSTFRYLSEQTLSELQTELNLLTAKYRRLAQRDALMLARHELKPVKWSFAAAEFSPLGKWPLAKYVTSSTGKTLKKGA